MASSDWRKYLSSPFTDFDEIGNTGDQIFDLPFNFDKYIPSSETTLPIRGQTGEATAAPSSGLGTISFSAPRNLFVSSGDSPIWAARKFDRDVQSGKITPDMLEKMGPMVDVLGYDTEKLMGSKSYNDMLNTAFSTDIGGKYDTPENRILAALTSAPGDVPVDLSKLRTLETMATRLPPGKVTPMEVLQDQYKTQGQNIDNVDILANAGMWRPREWEEGYAPGGVQRIGETEFYTTPGANNLGRSLGGFKNQFEDYISQKPWKDEGTSPWETAVKMAVGLGWGIAAGGALAPLLGPTGGAAAGASEAGLAAGMTAAQASTVPTAGGIGGLAGATGGAATAINTGAGILGNLAAQQAISRFVPAGMREPVQLGIGALSSGISGASSGDYYSGFNPDSGQVETQLLNGGNIVKDIGLKAGLSATEHYLAGAPAKVEQPGQTASVQNDMLEQPVPQGYYTTSINPFSDLISGQQQITGGARYRPEDEYGGLQSLFLS